MKKFLLFSAFTVSICVFSCGPCWTESNKQLKARVKFTSTGNNVVIQDANLNMFKNGDTVIIERVPAETLDWRITKNAIAKDTMVSYRNPVSLRPYLVEYRECVIIDRHWILK